MIGLVVLLAVIVIVLLIQLYRLKKDIQNVSKQLLALSVEESNSELVTLTFQKDMKQLTMDMNHLIRHHKELRVKNEETNNEMKRMITNLSHDLRTPLTSAIGYAQMLKDNDIEPVKSQEYLSIIEYRLKVLSGLINELLDYSRLLEQDDKEKLEDIHVNTKVVDLLSTYYDQFVEKDFKVSVNIDEEALMIRSNPSSFDRLIMNLIQNAINHGEKEFSLSLQGNQLSFRNKLPSESTVDVSKLFERFYNNNKARNNTSTGLGLAITRELVERMGASIKASRECDYLDIVIEFEMC